jgi:hypothetical protein
MRVPSAAGGPGGFHGAQDSLQVLSLQGQNHLEFGAARDAFGGGKTGCHRRQPAGIQRRPGHLGTRRAAHRLAQHMHDVDIPHACTSPRSDPAGYESEAEGLLENVEGKYRFSEVTVRPASRSGATSNSRRPAKSWTASRLMLHRKLDQRQGQARSGACPCSPTKVTT